MPIDTKHFKDKIQQNTPTINLVPLLDVIFTVMIFLLVMLSQHPTDMQGIVQDDVSGKPVSNTGDSEYYLLPLEGLHSVTVNGIDKSSYIREGGIAVHTEVMDQGTITMDSASGTVVITAPDELVEKAVRAPATK